MRSDFLWLAALLPACATNIVIQIVWANIRNNGDVFRSTFVGCFAGLAALTFMHVLLFASFTFDNHVVNFGSFGCFAFIYFQFNTMGETARRVRLAIELRSAPAGLTRNELFIRYSAREIIDRRIERMVASAQIYEQDSKFHLRNSSILVLALRIINLFRWALAVRSAERQ